MCAQGCLRTWELITSPRPEHENPRITRKTNTHLALPCATPPHNHHTPHPQNPGRASQAPRCTKRHRHAEVHPTLPGPTNRAYLVDQRVLITGDKHPAPPSHRAVPSPWSLLPTPRGRAPPTHLIRYVRVLRPEHVVGIHDGLLNTDGLSVARQVVDSLRNEGAARATMLADGEAIEIPGF